MGNVASKVAKAVEAVEAGPKKLYKVLANLRHDGKGYPPKSTVSLTDAQASPLLKSKVVEPAKEEKAAD